MSAFRKLGIDYALAGSLASSMHGHPRLTFDADVSAEPFPGKESALVASFGADYYLSLPAIREAVRDRATFNIFNHRAGFKVEVFLRKERPFDRSFMSRRRALHCGTHDGPVIDTVSTEDVILLKLEWYRLGNEIADKPLEDVIGVILVQGEGLDRAYLARWAEELGVSDLLERVLAEAHV